MGAADLQFGVNALRTAASRQLSRGRIRDSGFAGFQFLQQAHLGIAERRHLFQDGRLRDMAAAEVDRKSEESASLWRPGSPKPQMPQRPTTLTSTSALG